MNVQEFIEESLFQIAAAVHSTNKRFALSDFRAVANPNDAERRSKGSTTYVGVTDTEYIDFDIAVTASESHGLSDVKGGKLGISVVSVGADSGRTSESLKSSVSHLKFKIPLKLPPPLKLS